MLVKVVLGEPELVALVEPVDEGELLKDALLLALLDPVEEIDGVTDSETEDVLLPVGVADTEYVSE